MMLIYCVIYSPNAPIGADHHPKLSMADVWVSGYYQVCARAHTVDPKWDYKTLFTFIGADLPIRLAAQRFLCGQQVINQFRNGTIWHRARNGCMNRRLGQLPRGDEILRSSCYPPRMSGQKGDDDQIAQRRDAILRRLLQTPPQSRADLSEKVRRAKGKATRTRGKRATAGKREGAA